jgi:hypothetical protein
MPTNLYCTPQKSNRVYKDLTGGPGDALTIQKNAAGTPASTAGFTFSVMLAILAGMPTIWVFCSRKPWQQDNTPADLGPP